MGPKKIFCGEHGATPWEGEICCTVCNRVFQTNDEKAKDFAPKVCPCGRSLMPKGGKGDVEDFTARAICHTCYLARKK